MMMRLLLLSALVGTAFAGCPNSCSGHGTCKLGEVCECQPRWLGADCSLRECPYGVSWVTSAETASAPGGASYQNIPAARGGTHPRDLAFMGGGGRHEYSECSSKGTCDRSSGECQCFEGFTGRGCRQMKCPSDCSGNGMCMTNKEINPNYHSTDPNSQMWDWDKATQCKCDSGYNGLDCSKRTCPVGDDPLTNCQAGTQISDIQMLAWYDVEVDMDGTMPIGANFGAVAIDTLTDEVAANGYFTLTYTDAYGANYTTRPIYSQAAPTSDQLDSTAADIESALENLPNFAVPNVTVTGADVELSSIKRNVYYVTFLDDANAGKQHLLQCSYTEAESQNYAAASPRFAAPDSQTVGTTATQDTCTAYHMTDVFYNPASGYAYKDAVTCSNRGDCDESSGQCECWEGFTGEACHEQTVFF